MFEDSPRVEYAHNPLTEVVCQLRFPEILRISAGPPVEFQDRVRKDFPHYSREQQPGIPADIVQLVGKLGVPFNEGSPVHRFKHRNDRMLSLQEGSVSVTDHDYKNWGRFWGWLQLAESSLQEEFEPSFYSRIGLRYINSIKRSELGLDNTDWDELVRGELRGFLRTEDVEQEIVSSLSQTTFDIGNMVTDAKVTIRCGLVSQDEFRIDSDFYIEEVEYAESIEDVLTQFNRLNGNFFRWAIRTKLEECLGRASDEQRG